jgi:hypothetical protein
MESAEASPRGRQDHSHSQGHCLLDGHGALLPADELHRLRATAPAGGGRGVYPPRLSLLLSRGTLVCEAPGRDTDACARAAAPEGMGLCGLRHQSLNPLCQRAKRNCTVIKRDNRH